MKKIEVFRKSDNELVAADMGESISIESLKSKMIHKFDIESSEFEIIESEHIESIKNIDQIRNNIKNADLTSIKSIADIKVLLKDIIDLIG